MKKCKRRRTWGSDPLIYYSSDVGLDPLIYYSSLHVVITPFTVGSHPKSAYDPRETPKSASVKLRPFRVQRGLSAFAVTRAKPSIFVPQSFRSQSKKLLSLQIPLTTAGRRQRSVVEHRDAGQEARAHWHASGRFALLQRRSTRPLGRHRRRWRGCMEK